MANRILLVDDEPRSLEGLRRTLAAKYTVDATLSAAEALKKLEHGRGSSNPFAVVLSDMVMPEMNGAEFLSRAREINPDVVRMIVSGDADLRSTITAINNCGLFRFITKPCSPRDLTAAVDEALAEFLTTHNEGEQLKQAVAGSVKVLAQALSMASPEAGGRNSMVTELVAGAARQLGHSGSWELRMAARLSQLGLVSIPQEVLQRVEGGIEGSDGEKAMFHAHPAVARDLLVGIPRLERVAAWVGAQATDATVTTPLGDPDPDPRVETQRQIFMVATEFLAGRDIGEWPAEVCKRLLGIGRYQAEVVRAVQASAVERDSSAEAISVTLAGLKTGMRFVRDVKASTGVTLVRKGDTVSDTVRVRLANFASYVGIIEPLRVVLPKNTRDF